MNHRYAYIIVAILIVILGGLYIFYRALSVQVASSNSAIVNGTEATSTASFTAPTLNQTDAKIANAYTLLYQKTSFAEGDPVLLSALQTFETVAAYTGNSNVERAEALNGINYAYTMSNFDANDLYTVVFAAPPFSQYYTAPSTTATDPLHPESGAKVAAVENALVRINELSNALYPNQYAITRMETAAIFAYERAEASAGGNSAALQDTYADQIKNLASAYAALPPLADQTDYDIPMKIQIMYAHASALTFVGDTYNDQTYLSQGEQLFQQAIALGDASSATDTRATAILDETTLARIFYASLYWQEYKTTDPSKIENVLLPMITNPLVQQTDVYTSYLPNQKNAKVPPITSLRAIAQVMPKLKTFLEGLGWTF